MTKKSVLSATLLALLACAPLAAVQTASVPRPLTSGATARSQNVQSAVFQLSNFNFEHAMLFNMVNSAIQNSGSINSFNAGPNAGVLSVTIRNVGTAAGYCYVIPIVKQGGNGQYNCTNTAQVSQLTVATGPLLVTTTEIQPGQTLQANVSNFQLASGSGYSGAFCTNLQNIVNNNFGGNTSNSNGGGNSKSGSSVSLNSVDSAVNQLLQLQLSVCLLQADGDGVVSGSGDEVCTQQPIGIFSAPPSVMTTTGLLVYPNDMTLGTAEPTFLWTPSLYQGSSIGLQYQLVLSQSENGAPWYSVSIPSGQTFYRYQATDRVLAPGQKYYWHVVTVNAAGQSVGGQNGQGWNNQDWFVYKPMGATGAGAPVVSLPEIGTLIQQNASPAVLKALTGMQILGTSPMGALSDPDVEALVAKPAEIKTISVQKF